MIRRALLALLARMLILASPPLRLLPAGSRPAAPRPADTIELRATAINDRRLGGVTCHGEIEAVDTLMLVG